VTENAGAGALRGLAMRTEFISYDRPRVAAARMLGRSFPFTRWAASMKHQAIDDARSLMVYTYTFEVGPPWMRWAVAPVTAWIFDWQTRRRFRRLQAFLRAHAQEVARWQATQTP
jgi:hypothetical protein